jgi:four helix bundle protein
VQYTYVGSRRQLRQLQRPDVFVDVDGDGDGDEMTQPGETFGRQVVMLSFQKLDVYRCAIEFLVLSTGLVQNLLKGHVGLADQLRRAALSIPLNIAEAAGRTSEADRARHYAIARGSAMECGAIVDALDVLSELDDGKREQASDLLARIVAMLTKLCR